MTLFSYVVARDYGFAPNPFAGFCTLATCKPKIRSVAQVNDWVLGTEPKTARRGDRVVYAMRVTEAMPFTDYWDDARFLVKRPNLRASLKLAYGDNIYHRIGDRWAQENSHHSLPSGLMNPANVQNDTGTDRVLISTDFAYWGRSGPSIPLTLRNFQGQDIRAGRGHKSRFPEALEESFIQWFRSLGVSGCQGKPFDWK